MSDSRWRESMVRPHTLDQTDVYKCGAQNAFVQRNPPAICTGKSPPRWGLRRPIRGCVNRVVTLKIGWNKRGQYLAVILHSLYEEHAVRLLLFLWCRAAPVSGFDLKGFIENRIFLPPKTGTNVSRPCKHKTAWLESSEKHEGLGTLLSCTPESCPESGTDLLLPRPQEWFSLSRNDQ